MKNDLLLEFKTLLEKNQIPFMEITQENREYQNFVIKVYFPKIIKNLCKFFNDNFSLENKDKLLIKKDIEGYHQVEISFFYKKEKIQISIKSILQNTWGIANKL